MGMRTLIRIAQDIQMVVRFLIFPTATFSWPFEMETLMNTGTLDHFPIVEDFDSLPFTAVEDLLKAGIPAYFADPRFPEGYVCAPNERIPDAALPHH
jgi:hypothetical protein